MSQTQKQINLALGPASRPFSYRPSTSDEEVLQHIFKNGEYNFGRLRRGGEINDLYRMLSANGTPLIIDAGANIGATSVYFSYSFPKARVVAIEPEQSNFGLLKDNAKGLPIECLHAALASKVGEVGVLDAGEGHWGYRTGATGNGSLHSIKTVTINDIYASHPECTPFIAKIDIEGGESELFSGNTEWVAKTPLIIVELHDWMLKRSANSRMFLKCIAEHDRDFIHIGENIFSLDNSFSIN